MRRALASTLLAMTLLTVGSGHNGGCHADDGEPLPSPVDAIALLLVDHDGSAEVGLTLLSRALVPAEHVDGAVEVTFDGAPLEAAAAGIWTSSSYGDAPSHAFAFGIGVDVARRYHVYPGSFAMTVHGPTQAPTVWIDGARVGWSPAGLPALVQVLRDGAITFTNFDAHSLEFDGAAWSALQPGGALTLPDEAFPLAGSYEVRLCTVELRRRDDFGAAPTTQTQHLTEGDTLSGEVGSISGALVGRCARIETAID
jgi:hypothetical protein